MLTSQDMFNEQERGLLAGDLNAWNGEMGDTRYGDSNWDYYNPRPEGMLLQPSLELSGTQTGAVARSLLATGAADNTKMAEMKPPKSDPEESLFSQLSKSAKEGIVSMLKNPNSMAQVLGAGVAASAQGVMAYLKAKQDAREKRREIEFYEKRDADKVARASAVPTYARLTKDGNGTRAPGTFAMPTPKAR